MTPAQLAVIHQAKKKLGWNDDMYRAVLQKLGGVASAKDLNADGFNAVMEYATAWGFRSSWNKRTFGHRRGMATVAQVQLILDLWREFTGGDDTRALDKWLEKSFKVTALRFANAGVASKAINGLKAMNRRKQAKAAQAG
jgi:hypothetical protein